MAIAPNQSILYDQNAPPLDLGSVKNNFKKIVCCIPFAGDLLGLPIQAKLARQEIVSLNFYHKRQILRESIDYDCAELIRSYITLFSIPRLLSLALPSPLIIISLIGFSILLKNIFIFGDLERRFGKYSAIAKIALFALNYALFSPQLRMFFLTKNIGYLGGAIVLGQMLLIIMKFVLFKLKDFEYNRVQSAIQGHEWNIRLNLYFQNQINRAAGGTLQGALASWSSLLPAGQEPLPEATTLLLSEVGQRSFQIFLNRLQETADFRHATPQNRQDFALRVATIVRDMAASEEFREKAIMALGGANDACGDRVATGIESLEILSLIHGQNKPETDVDTACLAIRLARLDQVRKKAIALNPGPEGLETVLFLQLELKDRLKLPLQTGGMLYPAVGAVPAQDVNRTAQEILAATSTDDQVCEILVNSMVWTDFLLRDFINFYQDVQEGFTIIAQIGEGTDYQASLDKLQQNPTDAWTEFLDNVGPPNTPPENREALQREVLETLEEACPSLTGTEYSVALTKLIQQIDRKKTIEWLRANRGALRAKLN